jgi:ethanolamine kinase
VGFYLDKDKDDVVIVKMYGERTEMFIDRDEEIKTMQLLHNRKCGPILYAIFENGIAYEYTPGAPLNVENCRAKNVYPLVAKEMARMHSIPLTPEEREKGTVVWTLLKTFEKLSVEALESNPEVRARYEAAGIDSQWGRLAIEELEALCSKESMPLAFCHNDILLGNVILDEKRDTVAFIDFEYAGTNYVPFDIANHFNEFAGGEDIDFALYPDEEFQRAWIGEYLKHFRAGEEKHGYDVDTFYRWVQLCTPVSLVLWMVWGIVQTCYSKIDYDFFTFVAVRLPEYNKAMEAIRLLNKNC